MLGSNGLTAVIIYVQMPLIKIHIGVSSGARGIFFGLSLHLHPYFVYASSKCSGEPVHMCGLV